MGLRLFVTTKVPSGTAISKQALTADTFFLPVRNLSHIAPRPIHFTFFVKWVGNHELNPTGTVIML
jgi:hypothetical protein